MNEIDADVPRVDCVDDYTSEKQDVLDVQGNAFPFSYGDYIIKALLGAVDPAFDNLDEKNLLTGAYFYRINPKDYYSVAKGSTSINMIESINSKITPGTNLILRSPVSTRRGQPPSYVTDTVTVTSISRNWRTITFTPPLANTHHNYERDCFPGTTGCLPGWWGGRRTRRRSRSSKTRRNKRKTKHKSRK